MATYEIEFAGSIKKDLRKLSRAEQKRILGAVSKLAHNPQPAASRQLKGVNSWRLRVGDCRVVYDIHGARLLILVLKIGHRREVYR